MTARRWELTPGCHIDAGAHASLARALDQLFGLFQVSAPPSDPPAELCLAVDNLAAGGERLRINGLPIFSWAREAELPPLLESVFTDYAIHLRTTCLAFHAAALEINGVGVLITGGKGCGKSTLSLWMAQHGAGYGGDEIIFLDLAEGRIECFPKAATIKEVAFPFFGEAPTCESPVRGRLRYLLPASARPRFAPLPELGLIVLPDHGPDRAFSATRLTAAETARLLVQQSLGGLRHHPRAAGWVAQLASRPACWVEYAHPEQIADFIFRACGG